MLPLPQIFLRSDLEAQHRVLRQAWKYLKYIEKETSFGVQFNKHRLRKHYTDLVESVKTFNYQIWIYCKELVPELTSKQHHHITPSRTRTKTLINTIANTVCLIDILRKELDKLILTPKEAFRLYWRTEYLLQFQGQNQGEFVAKYHKLWANQLRKKRKTKKKDENEMSETFIS